MLATELLQSKVLSLNTLINTFSETNKEEFAIICKVIVQALQNGQTIFWCGNGGSAGESSHLAVELIGRFKENRRPFSSLALNADSAAITCIANDFGYAEIFARQLEGLAKPGDILIALSTSGQSPNILEVLKRAKKIGVLSIALLGKHAVQAASMADHCIIVNSTETARIQEIHLLLGHVICEYVELTLQNS